MTSLVELTAHAAAGGYVRWHPSGCVEQLKIVSGEIWAEGIGTIAHRVRLKDVDWRCEILSAPPPPDPLSLYPRVRPKLRRIPISRVFVRGKLPGQDRVQAAALLTSAAQEKGVDVVRVSVVCREDGTPRYAFLETPGDPAIAVAALNGLVLEGQTLFAYPPKPRSELKTQEEKPCEER